MALDERNGQRGDAELLRPYVPRLVVEWLRDSPDETVREVDGTLAFVDISGFTTLTERLARKGRIGAEEMSDVLSATFGALLAVAYDDGAGLVKWGGDAVLLLFTGEHHALHAARASYRMRRRLQQVGRLTTAAGRVALRMSVGIHSGTFHFFLVGDPARHRELLVSGPAASRTAEVEGIAVAGEIGLSEQTARLLPARLTQATDDGIWLLTGEPDVPVTPAPPLSPTDGLDLGLALSAPVREHLMAGGGEPEHRTIAVAFVQFSGTDDLLATDGPDALAAALDQCIRNVQEATERHGVTFFETDINRDGGKIMLVAGAPRSGGRNEERMLLATRLILDRPGQLPLRIGVNAGPVFSGDFGPEFRRTYSVKGDAINLAARVMGKAAPGQLLATAPTLAAASTRFAVEPLPPFSVKGKTMLIEAASVGPLLGHSESGLDVPVLGRAGELADLTQWLAKAVARTGSVVEVVGEPGIGKTRLVEELRERASELVVLATSCEEYERSTPYFPVRSLLREATGLAAGIDPGEVLRRLTDRVAPNHPELVPWLPLLGVPLDVALPGTPETDGVEERFRRDRVADVTVRFLQAVLPTAALLVIDDVHLMDEASADLLGQLAAQVPRQPWLLLVTRRPVAGGLELAEAHRVAPAALDRTDALAFIALSTADHPLPPHRVTAIADRSGGNPLFLRSLVLGARSGTIDDVLPDSLESLVTSQLDALPSPERTLLRFASVLGVTFAEDQLRAVLEEDALALGRSTVRRLADFLEPAGHGRFRFRNAVLRDTAYQGLSYRRRKELHGRVGAMLETQGNAPADLAELLSLHYFAAGLAAKAWTFSQVAGERSRQKYAYVEAAVFYRRAVESARRVPSVDAGELASVHEALADAQLRVGDYDDARAHYRAARRALRADPVHAADLLLKEALLESRQGRLTQSMRVLSTGLRLLSTQQGVRVEAQRSMLESNYAWCRHKQGRFREALRWGRAAEEHALRGEDAAALGEAYMVLQAIATWSSHAHDRPYGELALRLYEQVGDRLQRANVLNNMAGTAFFEGRWTQALEMFGRAHADYLAAGDVLGAAIATFNEADIQLRQNRLAEAELKLREVLAVVGGLGEPEVTAATLRELGRTLVLAGRLEEGRELLDVAAVMFAEHGAGYELLVVESAVIEHLLRSGEVDEALVRSDEALLRAAAADAVTLLPTFRRLRGASLLAGGRAADAQSELAAALAGLDGQGAHERGFLLLDLARVNEDLGDPAAIDLRQAAGRELDRLGVVG